MTYNSTLPKVFVYLLTTIETLYQMRVPLKVQNRKNVHLATSDCLVIACYLWCVLHFVKRLKLSTNWLKVYFLISQNILALSAVVMPSYRVSKSFAKHSSLKRLKELVYRLLTASPFLCVSLFVISEAKLLEIMQMLATMLQRDSTSMDINVMLQSVNQAMSQTTQLLLLQWLIVQ